MLIRRRRRLKSSIALVFEPVFFGHRLAWSAAMMRMPVISPSSAHDIINDFEKSLIFTGKLQQHRFFMSMPEAKELYLFYLDLARAVKEDRIRCNQPSTPQAILMTIPAALQGEIYCVSPSCSRQMRRLIWSIYFEYVADSPSWPSYATNTAIWRRPTFLTTSPFSLYCADRSVAGADYRLI